MTQEHLAKLLRTKQAAISKLERRTDIYLSTLQSIVKAMGQLKVEAVFPEVAVRDGQTACLACSTSVNEYRSIMATACFDHLRRIGTIPERRYGFED